MTAEYLLLKRGLYYRPNNAGYTGIRNEAGRYDENEAYPDGGVTAIHESEAPYFAPACWNDVKVSHLMSLLSAAEVQRDRLTAALTPSAETKAAYMGEIVDGDRPPHGNTVSWTAIKEIMAMIRKEAGFE